MILNAIVIVAILVCAALWGSKGKGFGLFSGFLALCCTLAAGAIAFAAWEPVALLLLNMSKEGASFFDNLLQDTAWSLGLLLPFMVSLLVLRLAVDSLVKANLDFSDNVNTLGGMAMGACIGVVTMGILVTGIGYLRLSPAIMGYQPVEEQQGSPVYVRGLWAPVDKLVVGLYERLSLSSFASPTPLAHHRPASHIQAGMQRLTFKGQSRVSIAPEHLNVQGRYRIEGAAEALLRDTFQDKTQQAVYPDGSKPTGASVLEGYVITFESGAKEKGGVFTITPGQLRLVIEHNGEHKAIHPIAVVSQPDAGSTGLYRFRFDAVDSFIASVGGGSSSTFAFEFLLPSGAQPIDLLVKNLRVPVDVSAGLSETTFRSTVDRDDAIRTERIFTSFGGGAGSGKPLNRSRAIRVSTAGSQIENVLVTTSFPNGAALNRSNRGNLTVDDENNVIAGEHQFTKAQVNERGLDRNIRVSNFADTKDTAIVQVYLSTDGTRSVYGTAVEEADSTAAPTLVDANGVRYEPLGYYYAEGDIVRIRFTPGRPLRQLADAPTLSRTKRDQTLVLVYRPSRGVKIQSFAMGDMELVNFSNGIEISR